MRKLLLILTLVFPINAFGYEVDCSGYGSETGNYVYGECDDEDFSGYDSETGEYVYGDCEAGGSLDGYNSETGEYIYGDCEDE